MSRRKERKVEQRLPIFAQKKRKKRCRRGEKQFGISHHFRKALLSVKYRVPTTERPGIVVQLLKETDQEKDRTTKEK